MLPRRSDGGRGGIETPRPRPRVVRSARATRPPPAPPSLFERGDFGGNFAGAGLCYLDSTYARHVAAYHAEDLFLSYALSSRLGKTTFTAGVLNVLDASPAKIYDGALAATDPYSYELMGRFFYVRLAQAY